MGPSLAVKDTFIKGCKSISWSPFKDDRGTFQEAFNEKSFHELGLPTQWVQDNISWSEQSVLRGLHIQQPHSQGKLIRCLYGKILDVCLDVRPDSPTFGKWHAEEVEENHGLYCPPGTAHGFYAVEKSMVYYKCTTLYDSKGDGGINAFDPELAIPWERIIPGFGKPIENALVSRKDLELPTLRQYMELNNERYEQLLSAPRTGTVSSEIRL